jgi:hypothetical protein
MVEKQVFKCDPIIIKYFCNEKFPQYNTHSYASLFVDRMQEERASSR